MRLDSHQHFWNYNPSEHVWTTDRMGALKRDFLPEIFKPLLDAIDFDERRRKASASSTARPSPAACLQTAARQTRIRPQPEARAVFKKAANYCRTQGTSISKQALQFSSQPPEIPTTIFSSSSPQSVKRSVQWHTMAQ